MWKLVFKAFGLRSVISAEQENRVIKEFNEFATDIGVLVSTYQTCSIGVNLHKACSDMVMIRVQEDADMVLQAIGRIHRLGQTPPQCSILDSIHPAHIRCQSAGLVNACRSCNIDDVPCWGMERPLPRYQKRCGQCLMEGRVQHAIRSEARDPLPWCEY